MRDFDPAGAQSKRKIHHRPDALEIGSMHDGIDRERQLEPHNLSRQRALARESTFVAGYTIGGCRFAVLDRYLHVIEAGLAECCQGFLADADRRGDQIGVEPGSMRGGRDLDEVAACAGLAARQMNLQDAESRRLLEYPRPGRAIELAIPRI